MIFYFAMFFFIAMKTFVFEFFFVSIIIIDFVCDFSHECFIIIANFLFHFFIFFNHVDENEIIHVF